MDVFPWQQFSVAGGGWLLFAATVWLIIFCFVMGRLFSKSQVDMLIRPRDETIISLREQNRTLFEQNQILLQESVKSSNQFFQEIKALRESP